VIEPLLYLTMMGPDIQFEYACARAFSLCCAHLIVKPSSGSRGTFISHPSSVFGFQLLPLFLLRLFPMRIMPAVALSKSLCRGLANFLKLLLCLGPLASSAQLLNLLL